MEQNSFDEDVFCIIENFKKFLLYKKYSAKERIAEKKTATKMTRCRIPQRKILYCEVSIKNFGKGLLVN